MEVFLDTCGRRRVKFLLLLYLFVVKAAAACSKPKGMENTVLTDKSLLMNEFPEGSEVHWECAHGYVRDGGSGSMTCVDDNWTEPDLICKKNDCGPPKPQPNMNFNMSAGTLFGASIKVTCDKGFRVVGSSYKQCYATGWSGRAKCEIVTCGKPFEVTNGRHSWDSQDAPKYGETISYICNEGYTLIGKESIMCSETGQYDSWAPVCGGGTTEVRVTTKMATPTPTPTPTPPGQEVSTSTDSSATLTAHRAKTVTASATPTVSPSLQGGRGILTAEGKASTASVASMTSSPFQDKHDGAIDTSEDVGNVPVIVSVISVVLVVGILVLFLHKFLLKRKGSYDTREDLKPELLQFQNL
ncbi:complement decay-accelerating factor, GPI-anchored isoform X1 [Epinephelus lanceolatus]|uniref:complement decay-accelerating factor isoform X1 n=1 Tax=Epinephelus lanceolatus TaxID=310571 RepID=UPI0014466BA0|nr:complement decay-accelerating factor isoform X1 [Epinephelus lanceolatus]